jgi:hypothetical protein
MFFLSAKNLKFWLQIAHLSSGEVSILSQASQFSLQNFSFLASHYQRDGFYFQPHSFVPKV